MVANTNEGGGLSKIWRLAKRSLSAVRGCRIDYTIRYGNPRAEIQGQSRNTSIKSGRCAQECRKDRGWRFYGHGVDAFE